ncbi:MAG: trypsin-like serine peptidase [Mangrovicoccus sp.]
MPPSKRHLLTAEAQYERAGIGRLHARGGSTFCSASLIAPDLVLTAAHCVASAKQKTVWPADRMIFAAGWRKGTAKAHSKVAAIAVLPEYLQGGELEYDLALLRLADPMPQEIPLERLAVTGLDRADLLSVLSYAKDRPHALSRETGCKILSRSRNTYVTNCEAISGISGAPVFKTGETGEEIAAVVSSKVHKDHPGGIGWALVVPLTAQRIEDLHKILNSASPS